MELMRKGIDEKGCIMIRPISVYQMAGPETFHGPELEPDLLVCPREC